MARSGGVTGRVDFQGELSRRRDADLYAELFASRQPDCGTYYNFLRLGRDGYTRIQQASQDTALYLSGEIAKLGPFELLSDGSELPVFAWKMKEETNFTLFDMSDRLRYNGWLVPAYTMPKNCEDLVVQRIVVKEGFSRDMAEMLLRDMRTALHYFASQPAHAKQEEGSHFAHL